MRTSWNSARRVLSLIALTGLVTAAARPLRAEDAGGDVDRRVRELEEAIRQLKKDTRQLEVKNEDAAKVKPVAGYQDGFFLQTPEGDFKLKVGGYVHADTRTFVDNEDSKSTSRFELRRARVNLEGTLYKHFNFRLMPDFAGSKTVLQEGYLNAAFIPEFKPQFGKFKPPVGLERLQSANAITFIERALPTNLVPNRDIGGQVSGEVARGLFSYQIGLFNGVPDGGNGDTDINSDKDFAGRVFFQPFIDSPFEPARGLGFGISGTYGNQNGSKDAPDLPGYKTAGQATFFSYAVAEKNEKPEEKTTFANGDRHRYSPQLYYYWNSLGVLAEYVASKQEVQRGTSKASLNNDGWQITTSYVLTGEKASYKGIAPAQKFDPRAGSWGAFELALRYGELDVDDDAFTLGFADPKKSASQAREVGVGVNWHLNKAVRLMLDFNRTDFSGGSSAGGNRDPENAVLTRVQFVL